MPKGYLKNVEHASRKVKRGGSSKRALHGSHSNQKTCSECWRHSYHPYNTYYAFKKSRLGQLGQKQQIEVGCYDAHDTSTSSRDVENSQ